MREPDCGPVPRRDHSSPYSHRATEPQSHREKEPRSHGDTENCFCVHKTTSVSRCLCGYPSSPCLRGSVAIDAIMNDDLLSSVRARRGHFELESGHHSDFWLDLETL